jgi:hypothetical protein
MVTCKMVAIFFHEDVKAIHGFFQSKSLPYLQEVFWSLHEMCDVIDNFYNHVITLRNDLTADSNLCLAPCAF